MTRGSELVTYLMSNEP